jgi:membrane-associated phospholipid phosphatase
MMQQRFRSRAGAVALLCAVCATPASAQDGRGVATAAGTEATVRDSSRAAPPVIAEAKLLGRSVAHVVTSPLRWDTGDWLRIPVATGGLVVLSALDESARDMMRRNRTEDLDDFTSDVQKLGTVYNFRILLGFYAAGLIFDDERARAVAAEGLASSLVAAGLITPTLQWITGRSRPRASDDPYALSAFSRNISFPSGHTTHAFAVASVIATEYDAIWVKAAAYGLASVVGLSRMYKDAHHLSDVTAAALIGTAVGRSVAHFGRSSRGSLSISPAATTNGIGLQAALRF